MIHRPISRIGRRCPPLSEAIRTRSHTTRKATSNDGVLVLVAPILAQRAFPMIICMNRMPDLTLIPFLKKGSADRSAIVGATSRFDFLAVLKNASNIRIAVAFGHISGWSEIEDALVHSSAQMVRVLLGQAFFQTEPKLLLRLKDLQKSSQSPRFEVKLASAGSTFHPKVWIISHPKTPVGVVGSGNLSLGGLCENVECGILTASTDHVTAFRIGLMEYGHLRCHWNEPSNST
jgi:hypothetical protein